MVEPEILVEREEGVATVTLNRPDRLNALARRHWTELGQTLNSLNQEEETRVVVLTGRGRGFCAGDDVSALEGEFGGVSEAIQITAGVPGLCWIQAEPLVNFEKPLIGAINGVAAGGGLSLALFCDLRLASENARFLAVWVRRALVPDLGASYILARAVGPARALEICLTGQPISAGEAERWGLVNKVVPHDQLMPAARELALKLARGPGVALNLTKRAIYQGLTHSLRQQIEQEALYQALCSETEDFKEGVRSFLEKRKPVFKGK